MAGLAPLDRPDGSTLILRYRGTIATSQAAAATYPKVPAVIASDSAIAGGDFVAYIRFPFFDASSGSSATVLANLQKRFPEFVFDDAQLASESPHAPVACTASITPGVNVTDLSLNRRTWAQNMRITVVRLDEKGQVFDAPVSRDANPLNGAQIVLDTTTSGMGLNTGLPVLILQCLVTNNAGAIQAFTIDVTIEIKASGVR